MDFIFEGGFLPFDPEALIVAGFTGRDRDAVIRHIDELIREGVTAPETVPTFYVLPPGSAVQDEEIVVLHERTSGEAEIALLATGDELYVTLASDHTDRRAETKDIALSKQVCPKLLAREAWRFRDVEDHWDQLRLRSWIFENEERRLYQEGTAASLLAPGDLVERLVFTRPPATWVLLGGTVPALDGIRHSPHFWAELSDPVMGRSIRLSYAVAVLDPLGSSDGQHLRIG